MADGVDIDLLEVGHCRHPEWVTIQGGSWRTCRFPALVVLIRHPTAGVLLYDTGYAERFETATKPFPERFYRWLTPVTLPADEHLATQLRRRGVELRDIGRVLISHLHGDHIAGLRDVPQARFTALRGDVEAMRGLGRWAGVRQAFLPALLPDDFDARLDLADACPVRDLGREWAPFERGFDLIGDDSLIAVPLPGHTAAQMGLLVRLKDGRRCFLAADACWSARAFREGRRPAAIARAVLYNWPAYLRTLDDLGALARSRPELPIVPSHCAVSIAALRSAWGLGS